MAATAPGVPDPHTTSHKSRKQGGVKKEAQLPPVFFFLFPEAPIPWVSLIDRRTESYALLCGKEDPSPRTCRTTIAILP